MSTDKDLARALSQLGPRQIVGLDLLRMVAATVVVCYHFAFWQQVGGDAYFGSAISPQIKQTLAGYTHWGWVGVEIFFMISGYVISFSAEAGSAYQFGRSRFLRLAPGVWICAPISFLACLLVLHKPLSELVPEFIRSLVFFPLGGQIDGVYWTLGIEVCFYILIWALIKTDRRSWIDKLPIYFCLTGLGFWLFYFAGMSVVHSDNMRTLFHKAIAFRPFQLILLQHGCFFGLGIALKNLNRQKITLPQLALCAALVCTCWLEIVAQNGIIERSTKLTLPVAPALIIWTCTLIVSGLMISFNDAIYRAVKPVVPAIRGIGLTTYPLYLLHNSLGLAVAVLIAPTTGALPAIAIGIAAAYVFAYIVAMYAEPALRSRFSALLPKETSPFSKIFGSRKNRGEPQQ